MNTFRFVICVMGPNVHPRKRFRVVSRAQMREMVGEDIKFFSWETRLNLYSMPNGGMFAPFSIICDRMVGDRLADALMDLNRDFVWNLQSDDPVATFGAFFKTALKYDFRMLYVG